MSDNTLPLNKRGTQRSEHQEEKQLIRGGRNQRHRVIGVSRIKPKDLPARSLAENFTRCSKFLAREFRYFLQHVLRRRLLRTSPPSPVMNIFCLFSLQLSLLRLNNLGVFSDTICATFHSGLSHLAHHLLPRYRIYTKPFMRGIGRLGDWAFSGSSVGSPEELYQDAGMHGPGSPCGWYRDWDSRAQRPFKTYQFENAGGSLPKLQYSACLTKRFCFTDIEWA